MATSSMPGTACNWASRLPSSADGTASFSSTSAGAVRWDTPTFTIVIAGTCSVSGSWGFGSWSELSPTPRSAREGKWPQVRNRGHRRHRVDRLNHRQRPAHPGHRGVRVVTELAGHLCGTAADSQSLQRRRDGAADLAGGVATRRAAGSTRTAPRPGQPRTCLASRTPGSDVFVARISAIVRASLPFTSAAYSGIAPRTCPASRPGPLTSSPPASNSTTGQQESAGSGQQ